MPADEALLGVLNEARELGFLGPGPVEPHLEHARAYLPALPRLGRGGIVVDLGTGGGVPGLPLAYWRTDLHWVLVDAMTKRIAFVRRAAAALGLDIDVREARAETLALDPLFSRQVDVVVARSLAHPGLAAEYAAPFLKVGGKAVIAEPPGGDAGRWSRTGLAELGMQPGHVLFGETATIQILEQVSECPDRFPRRVGIAAKRPIF
ncbi:MAG: class I SAM-dependent methyltransferase [Acidimicrobiales bacterium]|nr:class I SAM-dependent methyltransferase [Acidimicrobiales bacterium]